MRRNLVIVLLAASGFAALAHAQVVHPEIIVGQGAGVSAKCTEPAVAVSQASPGEVAVVWQQHDGTPGGLPSYNLPRYAFSTNAGLSFGAPSTMDFSGVCVSNGFDPIIGASPTSIRKYFGAIGTGSTHWGPVLVAPRASGSASFLAAGALTPCPPTAPVDKPWLALGPSGASPSAPEMAFIGWGRHEPVGSAQYWNLQYSASTNHGASWTGADYIRCGRDASQVPVPRSGIGVWPFIIRHGAARGRVFASYSFFELSVGGFLPHLPEWTLSDDGGVNWTEAQRLDTYGIGQALIYDFAGYQALAPYARGRTLPAVDADPRNTENLFLAFAARADQNDPNTDIFVMHSSNSGSTFDGQRRYRIPDAALRLPGEASVGSHEFMPAICIDGAGGVNLMFARIEMGDGPTGGLVSIRYARWRSAAGLGGNPDFLVDFVPPFLPSGFSVGKDGNDYHVLAAAGCWVHAVYVHNDHENNVNVYHRRMYVGHPLANVNCDQATDEADLNSFVTAYSTGSGLADMDANGQVDAADMVEFMNSYNAANP